MLPSRSSKLSKCPRASRSRRLIQLRMGRSIPTCLNHPIKAGPLPERLYPTLCDVLARLLAQVRVLRGYNIAHSLRQGVSVGEFTACFEASELIQNHPHDGTLALELFVFLCLGGDGLGAVLQASQLAAKPHSGALPSAALRPPRGPPGALPAPLVRGPSWRRPRPGYRC